MVRPASACATLLLALVVAVLVPPLAAGGVVTCHVVTWHAVTAHRLAPEERLRSTVRALALAAEGEIARFLPALAPLAGSPLMGAGAPGPTIAAAGHTGTFAASAIASGGTTARVYPTRVAPTCSCAGDL